MSNNGAQNVLECYPLDNCYPPDNCYSPDNLAKQKNGIAGYAEIM